MESNTRGFLLTRQWRDTAEGLLLRFWLSTKAGAVLVEQANQQGVCFIHTKHFDKAKSLIGHHLAGFRDLDLMSFQHEPVTALYFNQQRLLRSAANLLKENHIEPFEYDVRTVDRYLMERFITAGVSISGSLCKQADQFVVYRDVKLSPADMDPNLRLASFDIETAYPSDRVISIAVYAEDIQIVFILGEQSNCILKQTIECRFYADERALLIAFIDWLQNYDPDILIGWNCINFDLRVLERACQRYGFKLTLGRNNEALEWRVSPNHDDHYFVLVPGRAVLDGIDLLKMASYHFESFSLEFVSQSLLGKGKLIDDPDHRSDEIMRLFNEDKLALAEYNLVDCQRVWEIFEHARLIPFAIERARLTGLPLDKIGGSVAAFENHYLPRLHRQGYVAPNLPVNPQGVGSPGGYVLDSRPGFYEHVLVFDFKSLYPSIIRSFLIDPYSLTEGDRHKMNSPQDFGEDYDRALYSKGFRGAFFTKENSILPNLIAYLWAARDKAKQEKNAALSHAIKIMMNSFYGVMGTPGCRFFDPRLPSSITLRGHEIMLQTKRLIEAEGYQVIYGDTDSIFVWLNLKESGVTVDQIGKSLVQKVNHWWKNHLHDTYQLESALELEYENHYQRFLMPTIRGSQEGTKKRYAGLISFEGFTPENPLPTSYRMVFKGLETVRTDWTHLARDFQRTLYEKIFLNQEYKAYLLGLLDELRAGKYDQKLVYRKRIRQPIKAYQKNVPPHVQAAKKAEACLLEQGKPSRYQKGGWIEYCYTVNGPEPLECLNSPLDYDLYIERQIAPIVDGIVSFLGTSFSELTSSQLNLI